MTRRARARAGDLFASAYVGSSRAWAKVFSVAIGGSFHSFGPSSVIVPPVRLVGQRGIAIGAGVYVGADSWLQVIEADRDRAALVIGDGSSIAGHCVLSAVASIELGQRVLLARNVYIADHSHAFADASRAILDQGLERIGPVRVGDGAWLGQNVVVCPGVTIGEGAVVGANSVVRDDVPPRCVVVGAPARIVRRLDDVPASVLPGHRLEQPG